MAPPRPAVNAAAGFLAPAQVAAVLNTAEVGGIFSAEEGACYASAEYLFCGLPVVSTACVGGREVWYDGDNSVIVEAAPEAVAAGVEQALRHLASGRFDRARIRAGAVERAREFRAALAAELQAILDENKVGRSCATGEGILSSQLCHKLGLY